MYESVFGRSFNPQFFGIEVVWKLLFIGSFQMVVASLWKEGTYTLKLLLGAPLKARYLHITIGFGYHFQSKEFYITVAAGGLFESTILTHYNCCLGPFESRVLTHYKFV